MHRTKTKETVTSLHDLSAVDLIAGYRAKQFSPSEVLEEVLAHIAAWEPHIKALYAFDPDGARVSARASTDRWHKDEPVGALLNPNGLTAMRPLCTDLLVDPHLGEVGRRRDVWREFDPEDSMRFYALRLHEVGMIKSTPQEIIAKGTDWRFLNELKRELKA